MVAGDLRAEYDDAVGRGVAAATKENKMGHDRTREAWSRKKDPLLSLEARTRGASAHAEVEQNPPRDSHRRLSTRWTG